MHIYYHICSSTYRNTSTTALSLCKLGRFLKGSYTSSKYTRHRAHEPAPLSNGSPKTPRLSWKPQKDLKPIILAKKLQLIEIHIKRSQDGIHDISPGESTKNGPDRKCWTSLSRSAQKQGNVDFKEIFVTFSQSSSMALLAYNFLHNTILGG